MYYPYFLTYILTGVFIGLAVFLWALKSGQFSEQQRARFLALEDVRPSDATPCPKAGFDLYFIFYLGVAAVAASFALIGYALFFR